MSMPPSILASLDDKQRTSLVDAMATVDRLLTASMIEFAVVDPDAPGRARGDRTGTSASSTSGSAAGYVRNGTISAADDEVRLPRGITLLATLHDEPAALGLLKFHDGTTHLKRMWVSPDLRGLGLGRRLLTTLEAHAAEHGIHTIQLETNFALTEAIALYRAAGYVEVPPFNDEPNGDLWFEKKVGVR